MQYIGKKEFNFIAGKDGCYEAWYGKGKRIEDANKGRSWTGGIHRIITPCKTEDEAFNYVCELMKKKKEPKENLGTNTLL